MGKSADAPDYEAAAERQGESSKEVTNMQTWANRPDQVTPYGTTTWKPQSVRDPATGQMVTKWTQTTELTPESQKALEDQFAVTSGRSDIARELLPRAADEFGQQMDWSQFTQLAQTPQAGAMGAMPTAGQYTPEQIQRSIGTNTYNPVNFQGQVATSQYSPTDLQKSIETGDYDPVSFQKSLSTKGLQEVDPSQRYYQEAGDALMAQFDARTDPKNARDLSSFEATLRNRGLKPGDRAYDVELEKLRQAQTDARTNASFQASQLAGQEASRMYGMDAATRQQQFGERQGVGAFANSAAQQELAQRLGIGQQEFAERMGAGTFANQAAKDEFQQRFGIGQQEFQERLNAGQFANQAAQSNLAQQLGIGQQRFQEQQGAAQFANSAAAQSMAQQLGLGQQRFQEGMALAGLGDQRQQTAFGQDMASANYQNQLRQQQIAEEMQRRGFSLNEINALISGQQVGMPNMPTFNQAGRAETVQYNQAAQNQYQAEQDAANAKNAFTNSLMQTAGSFIPS